MATPRKDIDPSRYLDRDDVRVNTARLERALELVPHTLREELLDALDHIRKGFFKALYINTGLKDKRFIATKKVGIGRHIKVYRNPDKGDVLDMELGIFTRSPIAGLLERGGTVTAKSGLMAVPLPPAKGPTGRLLPELSEFKGFRRSFTPGKANAQSLGSKTGGFFMLAKQGRIFLMRKEEGGKVVPYFILKNRVRIAPRLRMQDTWDRMEGYRMDVINKNVDRALEKI